MKQMTEDITVDENYNGYRIFLSRYNMRFIAAPLDDSGESESVSADSYEEIIKQLDRRGQADARAQKVKVAIPVVDNTGKAAVLTGIHRKLRKFTTKPELDAPAFGGLTLYPDHPRIRALIDETLRLDKRQKELSKLLHPVALSQFSVGSAEQLTHDYPKVIENLEEQVKQARELADKLPDPQS